MEDKSNHEVTSKFAGNEFVLWKSQILSLLEAGDLSEVLPYSSSSSSTSKSEDNNKNLKNIRKLNSFSAHYNKHGSINHSKYHHNNNYANHIISQNRQQITLVGSPSSDSTPTRRESSTTLPSTSSSSSSPYCLNNQNNASEAAAANAMVIVVRLILVILICVLLVKLRAPKISKRRKWGSSKRGNDDSQQLIYDNDDEEQSFSYQAIYDNIANDDDQHQQQQQQHQVYDNFDSNINIDSSNNKLNQLSKDNQQQTAYNFRNLNNLQRNNHQLPRRKLSQPELCSNSKSKQQQYESSEQLVERRRRHSDTSLKHLKLPPGPMGLPFLGYLPFVSNEIHLTLTSLSEKYGPIYQIFLGGIRVVVLNDASLVRQAFKQPVFSGRPDTQLTRILQGYGIVNSEGALWKEQRAFLHSALRKLGAKSLMSGSNGLEAKIQVSFLHKLSLFKDNFYVLLHSKQLISITKLLLLL